MYNETGYKGYLKLWISLLYKTNKETTQKSFDKVSTILSDERDGNSLWDLTHRIRCLSTKECQDLRTLVPRKYQP